MAKPRAGNPLSWAQRNVLALLLQRGRFLAQGRDGRWTVTRKDRPTPVDAQVVKVLIEEGAVEPTAHMDRRWFMLSERGRAVQETMTW